MTDRPSHRPTSALARALAAALVVALVPALAAVGCGGEAATSTSERQEEVARRGAAVMPFDLDATTHHFEPVDDGLVETVVAEDPADSEQVRLVRRHLAGEAERFARGDFADPAVIHGDGMPGLAELRAGAARIAVTYREVPAGGRITFRTADPDLVAALHRWGEAQVADHGHHATAH
ncbi:MAG TPA: hypothetical protein VIL48_06525 [Acidimicrobiales bacterium]